MFDQPVPDPVREWHMFAAYVQAVLDTGAKPMVTFAKFHPPYDDPHNIRDFVARCTEVVWGCIEQWGGEEVSDWYWCVWNEPNNRMVGGNSISRSIAESTRRSPAPSCRCWSRTSAAARHGSAGRRSTARIGAYWMDWIARLVTEVDNSLVGFASWHRYGDWRPAVPSATLDVEMWGSPDAPTGERSRTC